MYQLLPQKTLIVGTLATQSFFKILPVVIQFRLHIFSDLVLKTRL